METKSFRVVYAEDDLAVRAGVAQILVAHGVAVHECSNGDEAAQLCSVFKPDAVLLDLSMPEVDGCEAARRIRIAVSTIREAFAEIEAVAAEVQAAGGDAKRPGKVATAPLNVILAAADKILVEEQR